ncbi:hypothetical protein E2C01_029150 [Portunus trituberculatus]|uniref:Uncharacterized protein n=1 Tax=Portunus trituberculatus TaxID=210409 RepID=A0A5B7ER71_PORTR|nr:hypothetical protein [Portunus trituberculatus]
MTKRVTNVTDGGQLHFPFYTTTTCPPNTSPLTAPPTPHLSFLFSRDVYTFSHADAGKNQSHAPQRRGEAVRRKRNSSIRA